LILLILLIPGDGVDLLAAEWEESWDFVNMVRGTSKVENYDFDPGNMVYWEATTPKVTGNNNWGVNNAGVAVWFNKGDLKTNSKITLSYKSDYFLHMYLEDEDGPDALFCTILPSGEHTLTLELSKTGGFWDESQDSEDNDQIDYSTACSLDGSGGGKHFRLPYWWLDEGEEYYELNVGNVSGFQFWLPEDDQSANETSVEITKFTIENFGD